MKELYYFRRFPFVTAAIFLLLASAAADIASDRAALIRLRSAVGSLAIRWDESSPSPCSWAGVFCSRDGSAVIELRLPAKGLSGTLPPQAFSNMTRLRTLSLRYNSLTGPLPATIFESLTSLRSVYLQHNSFSGELPDSLFSLPGLVNLNLAGNKFSSPISSAFNNLTRLQTLLLDNNYLTGTIPDLRLEYLTQFNVSNNNLTGRIPDALSIMPASSFAGNSLCGHPLNPCHDDNPQLLPPHISDKKSDNKTPKLDIIIPSVLGGVILIAFIGFFLYRRIQKGPSKRDDKRVRSIDNIANTTPTFKSSSTATGYDSSGAFPAMGDGTGSGSGSSSVLGMNRNADSTFIDVDSNRLTFCGKVEYTFGLAELLGASAEVLGKGSHGMTYKAMVRMGPAMVVKRVKDVQMGVAEFREKIDEIGKLSQENLLPLRAYFCNGTECLLVYEYMPTGSLANLLYENNGMNSSPLSWKSRMTIAHGAAKGISYLHHQGSDRAHGNIKPSNILLSPSYEALVSDVGLAPLGGATSPLRSCIHYCPPEATSLHDASQKGDVYSFGYMLFELLSGKMVTRECRNSMVSNGIPSACEFFLNNMFGTALGLEPQVQEDVIKVAQLILACTAENPNDRPDMLQVYKEIEEIWSRSAQYGPEVCTDEAEGQGVHSKSSST